MTIDTGARIGATHHGHPQGARAALAITLGWMLPDAVRLIRSRSEDAGDLVAQSLVALVALTAFGWLLGRYRRLLPLALAVAVGFVVLERGFWSDMPDYRAWGTRIAVLWLGAHFVATRVGLRGWRGFGALRTGFVLGLAGQLASSVGAPSPSTACPA